MDTPTWWNNRLWRSTTAYERPSTTSSATRMSTSSNTAAAASNTPLPWSSNTSTTNTLNTGGGGGGNGARFRDRKMLRPTLTSAPSSRRDNRPLGSLRISYNNNVNNGPGTSSYYEESGVSTPSSGSVLYGRSVTPVPFVTFHSPNRSSSAAGFYSSTSLVPTVSVSKQPSEENDSSGGFETFINKSKEKTSSGGNINSSNNSSPENSSRVQVVNNGYRNYISSMPTRGVLASRFGRRIIRPNSAVSVISSTNNNNISNNNNNTQPSQDSQTQGESVSIIPLSASHPVHINSPLLSKGVVTNNPNPNTNGTTANSIPNNSLVSTEHHHLNEQQQLIDKMNAETLAPRSVFRGNLWQGAETQSRSYTMSFLQSENDFRPPKVYETLPPRAPLKSILKKSDTNVSSKLTQLNFGVEGQRVERPPGGPSLSATSLTDTISQTQTITPFPMSSFTGQSENLSVSLSPKQHKLTPTIAESIPDQSNNPTSNVNNNNNNNNASSSSNEVHFQERRQAGLLRRGLQSAPSLKRAVRFNMGNNAVIEFHPTDVLKGDL